jgi:hypothetical protein
MRIVVAFIFSFCLMVSAKDLFNDLAAKMAFENNGLAKKQVISATSYSSNYFNVDYICPAGWTITGFDSSASQATLVVTDAASSTVIISCHKFDSPAIALLWNQSTCFSTGLIAYRSSNEYSGKMPGIYNMWDTTYIASEIHATSINLKYRFDEATIIYLSQCHNTSESFSIYQHEYFLFTSADDYEANSSEYSQHWFNLTFKSLTSGLAPAPIVLNKQNNDLRLIGDRVIINSDEQRKIKASVFDLLGRNITTFSKTTNIGSMPGGQYLIRAISNNEARCYKMSVK